jgi:hypothetical protein
MKYSPDETSAHFKKTVNMVPWDIMRFVRFQIPLCCTDVACLCMSDTLLRICKQFELCQQTFCGVLVKLVFEFERICF